MVELLTDYTTQIYHVLSTDSRPDADPGAQLREIDTGNRFIFDGNSWNELAAGGTTPTLITKTFTENGTYAASSDNADGYSSVTVDVPSKDYEANDWLDLSNPVGALYSEQTSISAYMLSRHTGFTAIEMPNLISLPIGAFYGCSALQTVKFPLVSTVANENFRGCTSLGAVALPLVNNISQSMFYGCENLTALDIGNNALSGGTISGYSLNITRKLTVIVLRCSSVVSMSAAPTTVFTNSPFNSSGTGGTLYVPSALIADYQAATNWSTILGYTNNQILPIEGSIYETQYVDGTPIS